LLRRLLPWRELPVQPLGARLQEPLLVARRL